MKKYSLIILVSLLSLTACSKKSVEVVETTVNEVETTMNAEDYNINESVTVEGYVFDESLDVTSLVNEIAENYDYYKEVALKHGVIYTDGTKTDGPILMEEITPYEPGDTLADYELVGSGRKYNIIDLEPEDSNVIYAEVKELDELGLLLWMQRHGLDAFWEGEAYSEEYLAKGVTELEFARLVNSERFKQYGNFTLDDWVKMTLEEQREAVAKMAVEWNKVYNVEYRKVNEETEIKNAELAKYSRKVPKGAGEEYKAWYKANRDMFIMINNIDFTVGKVLPDYITEDNGSFYITQDALRDLYEKQGRPEDKSLEMEIYGYSFTYDVSNFVF